MQHNNDFISTGKTTEGENLKMLQAKFDDDIFTYIHEQNYTTTTTLIDT